MNETESEFGKGFIYNLILFTRHHAEFFDKLERYSELEKKSGQGLFMENEAVRMWFNGSSDHLYEIQIPKRFKGKRIEALVNELQSHALHVGHGFPGRDVSKEDFYKAKSLVTDIAIELDHYFKVEVIYAQYD